MPLIVQGVGPVHADPISSSEPRDVPSRQADSLGRDAFRGHLDIGLVNNMPDGAVRATERQFARLLAFASGPTDVRLHLFALPDIPRGAETRAYLDARYRDAAALEGVRLDALIVTGTAPIANTLVDEPYWPSLTRMVDWAEHNTVSTLWSCLAAHAALFHLDGVTRRRLPDKRFGLFECVKVAPNGLLDGAPPGMRVPHSRWHDLDEGDLRSHGYRIVSRSLEAGIDTFTKQWASLFVFLQGHPEYDVDSLFREYRRDAQRYLQGKRDGLPALPAHYFDAKTESRLALFQDRAESRDPGALDAFPREWAIRPALVALWRASSSQLYRNWLTQIAAAKR